MFALMISLFAAGAAAGTDKDDCSGDTTYELNDCAAKQLEASEARLQKYQRAAIDRYSGEEDENAAVVLGIKASSEAFAAYRSIECRTVFEDYKQGTIRTLMSLGCQISLTDQRTHTIWSNCMSLGCQISLTDQRTHTIWSNWIQNMDSTPPILPEPQPTE